jgi:hypothetical protein
MRLANPCDFADGALWNAQKILIGVRAEILARAHSTIHSLAFLATLERWANIAATLLHLMDHTAHLL